MNYDTNNVKFRLAIELVNQSSRNIFITGKAGTGKTTFLKYIRENCAKQIAVVAPTGVAAINAGGVTMHSFFQLPLSLFIPDSTGFSQQNEQVTTKNSLLAKLRMTNEKKRLLQELELLIIDEISMVRCDILDAIDLVLRHIRRKQYERFGGVQVLFIGDMFQLPPVIKDHEWNILKDFYRSPYFFDSYVLGNEPPIYIEFDKIYRQSEEQFIGVLNQVRNNELDETGLRLLEDRYNPGFRNNNGDGFITLTTHNDKARIKNETELKKLDALLFSYQAQIESDFPETAYPAENLLQLKVGSQVMFIKNDSEKIKRYFNGKIGIVTELDNEKIFVRCNDDPEAIEVGKEKWENIRYTLNKSTRQLDEEVLGSFTQYPLRLAWAITIHKSQGLTFEKLIIDAEESFAAGQVYVALSRCTTLGGVILQSRIKPAGMFTDIRILDFSKRNHSHHVLEEELQNAKRSYQLSILLSLFDYQQLVEETKVISKYLHGHESSFAPDSLDWINELTKMASELNLTAAKFQSQIKVLFAQEGDPGMNDKLTERLKAGSHYFIQEQNRILKVLQAAPVTDARVHANELNEGIKEIFTQLSLKKHLMEGFPEKLEIESYYKRKKNFVLPSFTINVYAGVAKQRVESPHPLLYQRLRKLRDDISGEKDLPIYIVAGSTTLEEMARYLPHSLEELRKISGFGDVKIEKYGKPFLDIILAYCKEKNLTSLIQEKTPKRERKASTEKRSKIDTKAESYKLYTEGLTVSEIAKQRNLTQQTIEGHLSYYVSIGKIDIAALVNREKFLLIEPAAKNFSRGSITSIKDKLGNSISFGEIRLVLAWLDFQKDQRPI
jgi:hypothetical protein